MKHFLIGFISGAFTGIALYLAWSFWYLAKKAEDK